jgi:GDPmannose 4,6-dehydratase
VREFCELAFGEVGLDYRDFVKKNEAVYRPAEVDLLIGDYSKARKVLGWEPTVNFAGLVKEMVQADLELLSSTVHHKRSVTVSSI